MAKKKIVIIITVITLLIIIYLPGFSRLQQLKEENNSLEKRITELREKNKELEEKIHLLRTDPTYVEGVAREELKKTKKGEIVYKVE